MLQSIVLVVVLCILVTSFAAETDRESDFLAKVNKALKASMSEKLTKGNL